MWMRKKLLTLLLAMTLVLQMCLVGASATGEATVSLGALDAAGNIDKLDIKAGLCVFHHLFDVCRIKAGVKNYQFVIIFL